ncbi:hypothetical protein PCI56_00340 [Plesiomonas shigelloides subsp. oncorhynchi]|nr:hypothetical protein [Plesiomonas shigelloides]
MATGWSMATRRISLDLAVNYGDGERLCMYDYVAEDGPLLRRYMLFTANKMVLGVGITQMARYGAIAL